MALSLNVLLKIIHKFVMIQCLKALLQIAVHDDTVAGLIISGTLFECRMGTAFGPDGLNGFDQIVMTHNLPHQRCGLTKKLPLEQSLFQRQFSFRVRTYIPAPFYII